MTNDELLYFGWVHGKILRICLDGRHLPTKIFKELLIFCLPGHSRLDNTPRLAKLAPRMGFRYVNWFPLVVCESEGYTDQGLTLVRWLFTHRNLLPFQSSSVYDPSSICTRTTPFQIDLTEDVFEKLHVPKVISLAPGHTQALRDCVHKMAPI